MTAAEKILQKALVTSGLDSRGWNSVQAGLRDMAFFSSQVAEQRILGVMREGSVHQVSGAMDMSKVRMEIRDYLQSNGYHAQPGEEGTIKDLMTKARLDVMLKTNVATARGFIQYARGMEPGAFAAFPAKRLLRIRQRKQGRDWAARWKAAGDEAGWEGVCRDFGEMVALKDSPIWQKLGNGAGGYRDALGNPYPPFAFGSGMGVVNVSRKEAIELGLISDEELREKTAELEKRRDAGDHLSMTAQLSASFDAGHWTSSTKKFLENSFGDQLKYTQDQSTGNVTVQWQRSLLKGMFLNYSKPTPEESGKGWKLGKATSAMLAECDKVSPKYRPLFNGLGLTVNRSLAKHTMDDGHWLVDKRIGNMPVTPGDLDLIPSLWRAPDYIEAGGVKDSIVLCIETFDGGILKLPIQVKNKVPTPTGLFKTISPTSSVAGIPRPAPSGTRANLTKTP